MGLIVHRILFLLLINLIGGVESRPGTFTVFVVQERWHTGIVLPINDIPSEILPEIVNYKGKGYTYVDVSWGDEKYYQYPNPGIFLGAQAVLWPTSAVIRLVGVPNDIRKYYPQSTIMEIPMDHKQFYRLCIFISESFVRDESGDIVPSTIYRKSRTFFLAKRKYSVFRTCNTWVALAFRESGFQIRTFLLVTANQLFRRMDRMRGTRFIYKDG